MKRTIRLTESDLKHIIKKSVGKILREFGSDGPDWDEPRVYNDFDYSDFYSRMSPTGPSQSANDFDTDEQLLNLNGEDFDDEDLDGEDFNDEDFDLDDESLELGNIQDLDLESKRRMGRILRESIRKVLKESIYDMPYIDAFSGRRHFVKPDVQEKEDSIKAKINVAIGNRFGIKPNVEVKCFPSYKESVVRVSIPDYKSVSNYPGLESTLKYIVSRVIVKYGYSYKTNQSCLSSDGSYFINLIFVEDDNSFEDMPTAPRSMTGIKSKSPLENNDDGDNINLNDPNSGEAIRRKYAGSNEWGSSSAMENPFSSGSIANLRRMYGGRRW